jgi:hypothetical protein
LLSISVAKVQKKYDITKQVEKKFFNIIKIKKHYIISVKEGELIIKEKIPPE